MAKKKQPVGRPPMKVDSLPKNWKEIVISGYSNGYSDVEIRVDLDISNSGWYSLLESNSEFSDSITSARKLRGYIKKPSNQKHLNQLARRRKIRKSDYKANNIAISIRNLLSYHVKNSGISKSKKTFDLLGYSPQELKDRLQLTFSNGMTLDNYGEWHVDHIIPVSWFDLSNEYEFNQCWRLDNLQAMWAFDNLSKNNRFSTDPQLKLFI